MAKRTTIQRGTRPIPSDNAIPDDAETGELPAPKKKSFPELSRRRTGASAQQRGNGQGQTPSGTADMGASQRGSGTGAATGATDDDDLQEAFLRAAEAALAERANITEARDCQRFYVGGQAQWDAQALNNRQKKNRPTLTVNRLPQFVKQLTGDVRKNPPSLKFLPARTGANQDTAEAYNGIARHIDQQSGGAACYVKAVENAAQTGQGFYRIVTEYSSDDAFDLDIRRRPILDPLGALIDPFCTLLDKSDMRYGFIFAHLAPRDFEKEFPDAPKVPVYAGVDQLKAFPWMINDSVRIAEYWRRVPEQKTLYLLPDGAVVEDLEEVQEDFEGVDLQALVKEGQIKTRDVEGWRVEQRRMCGSCWLDPEWTQWPGRYIPICMVVGEEITLDGSTVRKGMVHDARDPQRIYNYTRSAAIEAVALQPKAPFIATVNQLKGRPEWQTAGSENHSVLIYNPDPQAPGAPQRSQPAMASQGLDGQAAIAADDMKAVTGIYDAALGARSNETSGVAISNRQREGDTATFLFVDNLARAIGYEGKILADLIPRVIDNQRQIRILQQDGQAKMVTVNGPPEVNPKTKEPVHPLYDLSAGEYDVVVTTGPSFATQRQEAAANMTEFVRAAPQLLPVIGDLLVGVMDWPGADEMAARLRKAQGIPDENEPPPPPPPPDPAKMAAAAKDAATADKTSAEAEKTKVETAGMLMQLHMQLGQIQQMLAGGAPMGGPPGASPPGAGPMGGNPPMPAPPPAPLEGLPPMAEMPEDGLPPMPALGGAD